MDVEPDSGMAIAMCSGLFRVEDARAGAEAVWKSEAWNGKSILWDLRAAEIDMSTPEIREIARFILGYQPSTPPTRVAFVMGSDVDFGLARMFQAFRDHPLTEVRVFRDYDKAVSWARESAPKD